MCFSSPKMPTPPPIPAAPPPRPEPTPLAMAPSEPLKRRLAAYGGSGTSLMSSLRIPLNTGTRV